MKGPSILKGTITGKKAERMSPEFRTATSSKGKEPHRGKMQQSLGFPASKKFKLRSRTRQKNSNSHQEELKYAIVPVERSTGDKVRCESSIEGEYT